MKIIFAVWQKLRGAAYFFPSLSILLILCISHPGLSETSVADEIISLDATDQPLGEVLKSISNAANCRFRIDENWEDYPVTASFNDEPLHNGLKRIFRNINNAVIYGEDRTIRIIIYERGPDSGSPAGHSITIKSPQESTRRNQPFSEATAPQPEVEIVKEDSSPQSLMKETEAATEPDTETDEADGDNTEADEEASDEPRENEESTD